MLKKNIDKIKYFYANRRKLFIIILSHNHPSGIAKPSKADIEITEIIYKAFFMVNIKVMDHLIIAGNLYYSFRENGILDNYKEAVMAGEYEL